MITIIFNAVLRLHYFPDSWKLTEIKILPKLNKDIHEQTSYRPISLLPILPKLLEKVILDRIKKIINNKRLIPVHQFGFREKHATIEQVHRLYNQITTAMENKKYCTCLFLDVKKAFDKV